MKLQPDDRICLLLNAIIREFESKQISFDYTPTHKDDFMAIKPNISVDIPFIQDKGFIRVAEQNNKYLYAATKILNAEECTNAIMYPPRHMMRWHTNSDLPGTRTYYIYSERPGIFAYLKNGEVCYDEDDQGWTVRQFEVKADEPFWHAVWSDGVRYAFGFKNVA